MIETNRPLVTFALLSFNQEQYIEDAVAAVINQSYSPLQIIISDDASSDMTFPRACRFVEKHGSRHEIILNQNIKNLGIGLHINKIMELAKGEIVVVAAGDDISSTERVQHIVDAFTKSSEKVYSVWSRAKYINSEGKPVNKHFPSGMNGFTDQSMVRNINPVIGATHAWRREVFDYFGPLLSGVVFEDNAISFRSYLMGGIGYVDRDLVSYRTHEANITNYTKMDDHLLMYAAAAKRCMWALVGIEQRKLDLAKAENEGLNHARDSVILIRELSKMEKIFKNRLEVYKAFPKLNMRMFFRSIGDVEVVKVFYRSIKYRLRFF